MGRHLRFHHKPDVNIGWCSTCRANVTLPCIACQTRAAMATGLLRRRGDRARDWAMTCDFEPEQADNYDAFWREFPHGMGALAVQPDLDNSAAVATITEEETWFVKSRKD